MKKFALFLAAIIMIIPFFEGETVLAAADKVITLDMYFPVAVGGGPDKLISALCDQFNSEHPGIKVNPVYSGSYADTRTKVQAAIKAHNTPAIALMFSIDLFSLLSMNAIYDFESFCTTPEDKAWLNGFYPGFMKNAQTGGKTYGIPWQRSTIILYYNKDAFREVGLDPNKPPATWCSPSRFVTPHRQFW